MTSESRPTVSIALATYNGAHFLREQLDTLLAQSRPPDEIVVTDDGSVDDTLAILTACARSAPFPIHVHSNSERMGYRRNFLKAAELCTSDLIFFCDQDDIWSPSKLSRMTACFADPAVMLAYHNAMVVNADGVAIGELYRAEAQKLLLAQVPVPPWHYSLGFTQAFRRELLNLSDLWPMSLDHVSGAPMAHDQWLFFLALCRGKVAYVDASLVRYRQHGSNVYGASMDRRPPVLRGRCSYSPEWETSAAAAARRRSEILDLASARSDPPAAARAREIARCYQVYSERLARRLATHDEENLGSRLMNLAKALWHGDYRHNNPWRFRVRGLLRDLPISLLGRRMRNDRAGRYG